MKSKEKPIAKIEGVMISIQDPIKNLKDGDIEKGTFIVPLSELLEKWDVSDVNIDQVFTNSMISNKDGKICVIFELLADFSILNEEEYTNSIASIFKSLPKSTGKQFEYLDHTRKIAILRLLFIYNPEEVKKYCVQIISGLVQIKGLTIDLCKNLKLIDYNNRFITL